MTIRDLDNIRLDDMLRMFDGVQNGQIPTEILLGKYEHPEDWQRAVEFLTEEGYLKNAGHYFEITYKGKRALHDGGFVKQYSRERALFYGTVIAAVCSFLGLIVALIALIR